VSILQQNKIKPAIVKYGGVDLEVHLRNDYKWKGNEVVCSLCGGSCGQCSNSLYMAYVNNELSEDHWYVILQKSHKVIL